MIDHKKLAVIHIVKKELNLTDNEYRNKLEKICGVRSAKNLDDEGFRKLMLFFTRSGYYRSAKDGITFRQRMYIKNLASKTGWSEAHFKNFIKKYYKKEKIDTFSKREASKLIESLKNIMKNH